MHTRAVVLIVVLVRAPVYTSVLLHPRSCVAMYRCTSVLVYRYTRVLVYLRTGVQVYRYAAVPVYQCIGLPLGLSWGSLGPLGAIMEPSWCQLDAISGPTRHHLGAMSSHLVAMLGVSGQCCFLCDVIDPKVSEVRFAR